MKRISERENGGMNHYLLNSSPAHDEDDRIPKFEVIFSRIESWIYWINTEQQGVFL